MVPNPQPFCRTPRKVPYEIHNPAAHRKGPRRITWQVKDRNSKWNPCKICQVDTWTKTCASSFLCGGFLPHTIEPGTPRAPQAGSSICRPWPARPSVCKRAPAEAGATPSRAPQIGWQRHGRGVTPQSGKNPGILPVSMRQKRRIREIPY